MISPVTCLDLSCPSAVSNGLACCTSTPCYRTSKKNKGVGGEIICQMSPRFNSASHSLITSNLYLLPLSFHQVALSLNGSIKLVFLFCCNWGKFLSCDSGCTDKFDLSTLCCELLLISPLSLISCLTYNTLTKFPQNLQFKKYALKYICDLLSIFFWHWTS